ncbi:hypothetical protein J3R73_005240 [Labrys monachus]|uniref:Uncharacterized protein n=1 Tax=Labrys monachus TaxID=217067 RepID=A0ABU0FMZ1_9HYPH|nr:hypothetical protein [Labrys monachus]
MGTRSRKGGGDLTRIADPRHASPPDIAKARLQRLIGL